MNQSQAIIEELKAVGSGLSSMSIGARTFIAAIVEIQRKTPIQNNLWRAIYAPIMDKFVVGSAIDLTHDVLAKGVGLGHSGFFKFSVDVDKRKGIGNIQNVSSTTEQAIKDFFRGVKIRSASDVDIGRLAV